MPRIPDSELERLKIEVNRGHNLQYVLLYDGKNDNQAHLMGLLDTADLHQNFDNDALRALT